MVKIEVLKARSGEERVYVTAPYHPRFPQAARNLGGSWLEDSKRWTFDKRDEERARTLCREIYGTDGLSEPTLCTIQVALDGLQNTGEMWVAGREVARRPGRDASVRLGEGVIVVSGGFDRSGGSRKNPMLDWRAGTVLEVRDIPASLAEQEAARLPKHITRVE